jgi:hypothetical protein
MFSGYNKTPRADRSDPEFGPGATIITINFIAVLALGSIEWMLV